MPEGEEEREQGSASTGRSRRRPWALFSERGSRWTFLLLVLCLAMLALPLAAWQTVLWSESTVFERLGDQGRDRLTLYGGALLSEIEKAHNIPLVLSADPQVVALLARHQGQEDRAKALDRRLEGLNTELGTSVLYVLDESGLTLSASNWSEGAGSFVGHRFDFRPYFLGAMQGREAHYFALGTTSNLPGYYIAAPVRSDDKPIGAVVAKSSMDQLERGWSGGGEKVFVTDRNGIIIITNTGAWRFRSLKPLDPDTLDQIVASRQYGAVPPQPLGIAEHGRLVTVDGRNYVMVSQSLPGSDAWTLYVLMAVKEAQADARDRALLAVAVVSLAVLVLYFAVQRGRLMRRHNRELEGRVAERTAALEDSNSRLQGEVVERRRAEEELVAKQDELVQAAKLAALGQMSAGMAHEINQPLAAIRTYAENAVTLLGMGRSEMARDNLGEIAALTERMARITGQLKQFARKSARRSEPVSLSGVVAAALALLAGRLRAEKVEVAWAPPPADLQVWGEDVRLQQVLVNLFGNAADAMVEAKERRLSISAVATAATVALDIRDTGPGLTAETMASLFDPFFTTKPAGEGLGLGLSISEGIVRELGGRLTAANHPDGGAVFTVTLRRVEGA
jgi:two-component system, NtrC family, C4-dicarboxylate transport sensor histidine kinase DctB